MKSAYCLVLEGLKVSCRSWFSKANSGARQMHISPYLSVFNWCSASKGFDSGQFFTRGMGRSLWQKKAAAKIEAFTKFALDGWWNWGRWSQGCVAWSSKTGAVSLLGGPSGTAAWSLALLMEPLGFGGQITSVRGWVFRFCVLSLPISKDWKEMSGARCFSEFYALISFFTFGSKFGSNFCALHMFNQFDLTMSL